MYVTVKDFLCGGLELGWKFFLLLVFYRDEKTYRVPCTRCHAILGLTDNGHDKASAHSKTIQKSVSCHLQVNHPSV